MEKSHTITKKSKHKYEIIKNTSITNNNIITDIIDSMITWKLDMDKTINDKCPFRHLATFLFDQQRHLPKYTVSENSVREMRNGCCYGLHAEMAAIKKLPPLRLRGKKQIINLIVIRINKNGLLKNSAPCFMCIKHMEWINRNTSYKINNVYYSYDDGVIVVKRLNELIDSSVKHVSRRFNKRNKR